MSLPPEVAAARNAEVDKAINRMIAALDLYVAVVNVCVCSRVCISVFICMPTPIHPSHTHTFNTHTHLIHTHTHTHSTQHSYKRAVEAAPLQPPPPGSGQLPRPTSQQMQVDMGQVLNVLGTLHMSRAKDKRRRNVDAAITYLEAAEEAFRRAAGPDRDVKVCVRE